MNPMTLTEVRKHTGRQLTCAEAAKLANPGDPFLRNMAVALSLHTWNNTAWKIEKLVKQRLDPKHSPIRRKEQQPPQPLQQQLRGLTASEHSAPMENPR